MTAHNLELRDRARSKNDEGIKGKRTPLLGKGGVLRSGGVVGSRNQF